VNRLIERHQTGRIGGVAWPPELADSAQVDFARVFASFFNIC
jgi:hypothetical protein